MEIATAPGSDRGHQTTSDRFDRNFWLRLMRLATPYWKSARRRRALTLLTVVVVLSLGTTGMQAVFSYVSRDIMNALQAKDAPHFYHLLELFAIWIAAFIPIAAFYPYLSGLLTIDWRDWMTEHLSHRMFDRDALYHIMRSHAVDNPDQRISEDINSFTGGALNYSMSVLQAAVTAATFFGILWEISHWLAVCLVAYAVIGTWLTVIIGRRLVVINFNQQRYEADFRFALVRARDNAEAIALYRGGPYEERQLRSRFANVLRNFKLLLLWQRHLTLFTAAYDNAAGLVPYFVLASAYFSGRFELGEFTQAAYAFSVLQGSLSLIVDQFQALTDYTSVVNRLAAFDEACAAVAQPAVVEPQIEISEEGGRLALEKVTITTPDGGRVLQRDLSFEVREGERLLIAGPSGIGKTSLMRAVAGLWSFGSGKIERPPHEEMMFMPQKPYLLLGTLREQLQYPRNAHADDTAILAALNEVGLGHLPDQFGGLDIELDWAGVMSGGEQQRLAFARLLLSRPRFAFMDEATSALDLAAREHLYRSLTWLPLTLISIGHRPTLRDYHDRVIELQPIIPDADQQADALPS